VKKTDEENFKFCVASALDVDKIDHLGRIRRVSEYLTSYDSYEGFSCYLSQDEMAGFAIHDDTGELVSMFSVSDLYDGDYLASSAVSLGAQKLDCFDENGFLPNLYSKYGFRESSRIPWDDQYAPKNWRGDCPDVVYMDIFR